MNSCGDDRDRPSVSVVGGIGHELIVKAECPGVDRKRVIDLEYLFRTGVRKLAIAYQSGQSTRREVGLVRSGNSVQNAGDSEGIAGPIPQLSGQRGAARQGPVRIGESIDFQISRRIAGSRE